HPMFRSGLKSVLLADRNFEIIGEASTGEEAVLEALEKEPDVVLMDINMPLLDGIQATKQIKERKPQIQVLILTMYSDEAYLKEGLNVGASGYVLKRVVDTELITAIRTVLQGEHYIYPTLVPYLYKKSLVEVPQENATETDDEILSLREKEILKFITLGYTQKEIADELYISIKTVETYKARIMEKLGVKKRSDLVRYALKHNMILDE
ncbi:response regulator, partial [Brevibacillus sp. SYSU BS000544]|uniref:response regulator n=1 Tax=Brevibacillus sp. SYSU BS000544 TaxID=3416443 RepID=UPI003CE4E0C0